MALDPEIQQCFGKALELLTLHSSRAVLKLPFLGLTPQMPGEELPEGSELKAYQDDRELRDGLTTRLKRALRGHGLFATQRLAVALGKVWASLTIRGEGACFVLWLDQEFDILLELTELETLQIGRLRDKSRATRAAELTQQSPRIQPISPSSERQAGHPVTGSALDRKQRRNQKRGRYNPASSRVIAHPAHNPMAISTTLMSEGQEP